MSAKGFSLDDKELARQIEAGENARVAFTDDLPSAGGCDRHAVGFAAGTVGRCVSHA